MKKKLYEDRIIYQIYPLSFHDSNNDGYGDINGIISKLDYLKDLGVGLIWLSPIYLSPMKDNGYDIADYYKINPLFGTMEDFDNLIVEAKKRDIYIIMDLVVNHTSNEHYWFKEALKDKNSPYRDYYIFKEGKGKKPPNNWVGAFSGPVWEKVENEENTYYLHLFTKEQVDLNYKNEKVIEEVKNILKFYLDKGVVGFRCDVISQIYKTSFKNGRFAFFSRGREHYENQEGCFKILERLHKEVLNPYNAFFIGETSSLTPKIGNKFISRGALDMFFEFEHSYADTFILPIFKRKKYKSRKLIRPIFKYQEKVPWMAVYLENHDQPRSNSRFGEASNALWKLSAKALSIFLLSLRGTIFIYEGEEIGMTNYKDISYNEINDCMSKEVINSIIKILKVDENKALNMVNKTINRDHARSPMQWSNLTNAGFNMGFKTWIKVNEDYKKGINVEDEEKEPDSILNFYKKMIKFRNKSKILKEGIFKKLKSHPDVAKFSRTLNNETLIIVVNLAKRTIKDKNIIKDKEDILISNYENHFENKLSPYEALIYKKR